MPYYIKKAIEFVNHNYDEKMAIDDIVNASGVSVSTLFKGFNIYLGVTPMAYLRNRRLDAAHSKLKFTNSDAQTVTRIALDCGFNHLGKFSAEYQKRFGEKPLQSLRMRNIDLI
jgi:AraC-like DNA-binding protein